MADRWVIFDAMGVIFEVGDDVADLLVPFLQKRDPATSATRVKERYLRASRGEIPSRVFWETMGLGEQYPGVEVEYLSSCLTVDPLFREVAPVLKRSHRLAVLSNDVREWADYLYRKHELDGLFEVRIISGAVGFRKPQPEIFACFLARSGADPQECVFVDDNVANLQAAAALGFRTIWFARGGVTSGIWTGYRAENFHEVARLVPIALVSGSAGGS